MSGGRGRCTERAERAGRARATRGPWAVVRAVATVVLGPAAVTASALDQANAAPPHHPVRADTAARQPSDAARGRRRRVRRPRAARAGTATP
ncbi:hypothetical protein ABZ478_28990 [Streptomyces sp. NPDC005706]|uniref:hypothetical protein n=1 Tax=Streptomyces sp. NPDC005706 TaxID=3157169 RepID=UPI0033C21B1C